MPITGFTSGEMQGVDSDCACAPCVKQEKLPGSNPLLGLSKSAFVVAISFTSVGVVFLLVCMGCSIRLVSIPLPNFS